MAENENQANAKAVKLHIRKAGKEGLSKSLLYRKMGSRLTARDLDAILTYLVNAEEVEFLEMKRTGLTPKSGRPCKGFYRVLR